MAGELIEFGMADGHTFEPDHGSFWKFQGKLETPVHTHSRVYHAIVKREPGLKNSRPVPGLPAQFPSTFLLSFFVDFAAFFSLGVITAFFFVSRLFLCSLLIFFTPVNSMVFSSGNLFLRAVEPGPILRATTEIDGE